MSEYFPKRKRTFISWISLLLQTFYSILKLLFKPIYESQKKIKKKIYSHTSYTTDGKNLISMQLVLMAIKAIDKGIDSMKMIKVYN